MSPKYLMPAWVWFGFMAVVFAALIAYFANWIPAWTFWSLWGVYAATLLVSYVMPIPARVRERQRAEREAERKAYWAKRCANYWRTADDRRPAQPCDCPRCSF